MTSAASAKGAKGEREVIAIFDAAGFGQAQRGRAGAEHDRGDVAGVPALTIEVKNRKDVTTSISLGLRELAVEKKNNKTKWGIVAVKRPRLGWVAVMPLEEFAELWAKTQGVTPNDDS